MKNEFVQFHVENWFHVISVIYVGYAHEYQVVMTGLRRRIADLLQSKSYEVLIKDVLEAKYIGHGVIDGRECEHLAFRNFDTDWQLWVEIGPNPIPRKMVITSKTLNSAPQFTLRIKEWKTDIKLSAESFSFNPASGMKKLSPGALIHLDELPQDSSTGEKQ